MSDYREFAVSIAQEAGAIVRKNFGLNTSRTWKLDRTPVTETDLAINKLVIDAVAATYPAHRVLGEEIASAGESNSEWTWVCDPIDGTLDFMSGIPINTFSLALTHHGESKLGVVFDPFCNRLFVGERGLGATLNNEPISVSAAPTLDKTLIDLEAGINRPSCSDEVRDYLKKRGSIVFNFYSSVYAAMLVACGQFSGIIHAYPYAWDAAAVSVIVTEAGGTVTDLAGNDQRYDRQINGFIASNGLVHPDLVAAAATEPDLLTMPISA